MDAYQDETYGERIAAVYDRLYPEVEPGLVETLAQLAGAGEALELGIGTGRIALPLQAAGVRVSGIDASKAMVTRLRQKVTESIQVDHGSFANFALGRHFSLVYVVFNTFFALLSQTDQVRCFRSVAEHLQPDGAFLIEAFVPDLSRFDRGQRVGAVTVDVDAVHLDVSRLDRASQQISSTHLLLAPDGYEMFPVKLRFAWPAELDLMAQMAGLKLRSRWGSWQQDAYDSGSDKHISIYERVQPVERQPGERE